MADDGRLDRAGLENRLRAELNLTVPRNELERLWVSAFDPDTAVLALVHRLRPVAALGLLTNNDALLSEALPIYLPETTEPFDALLFSGVLKVRKPAVTAYRKALAILGREPARTLFIDDSAQNVEGAQDAGLTAIRFTGADDLAAELRRLGLLTA
nr:HAD-IA family hydrolase [Actinomadura rayongensis]